MRYSGASQSSDLTMRTKVAGVAARLAGELRVSLLFGSAAPASSVLSLKPQATQRRIESAADCTTTMRSMLPHSGQTAPAMNLCLIMISPWHKFSAAGTSGAQSARARAQPASARSSASTGCVRGTLPVQRVKASAACSTSMPSPSLTPRAPRASAQRQNAVSAP